MIGVGVEGRRVGYKFLGVHNYDGKAGVDRETLW